MDVTIFIIIIVKMHKCEIDEEMGVSKNCQSTSKNDGVDFTSEQLLW